MCSRGIARVVVVTIVLLLTLVAILVGRCIWKALYPYGARPCTLTVMLGSLRIYAQDEGGWFPAGGVSSWESLTKVSIPPDYLAGVSGDRTAVRNRIESGEMLDSSVSSWVYFPGFRKGELGELAIIWEREPGITFSGHIAEEGSHAVGFADGHWHQVSGAEWMTFLAHQERLREAIQTYHSEHPEGGPMPYSVQKLIRDEIRKNRVVGSENSFGGKEGADGSKP